MADRKEIAEKIKGAQNILVALSKDPSVDEVSAALGLTLMLDKIGKKATAIYSGVTPDVLKFLDPEKTFSTDTNSLQDFIIALDKDKADHLRYKVDGDYVKVFITPYHEAISEDDLEYSYGDFNVDLIIALDVANESDLDGALSEYGRIMHDAGAVNITTKEGGNFSEVQWSNPNASSVCEMIAELGTDLADDAFEKNSATALLTGIVASTERFANEKTTPETMGVASKLMTAGADQSLIAENIERAEMGKDPIMMSEKLNMNNEPTEPTESVEPTASVESAEPTEPAETKESESESQSEPGPLSEPEPQPESQPEPEPQKPVLETPSDLLEGFSAGEKPAEDTASEVPTETEASSMPTETEAPAESETTATPETHTTPENSTESGTPAESETPTESEATPAVNAETPELPKATGSAPEGTTHKSMKLQPSAEAQAELEKMMQEEPKKNELLEEMNKESERLAAGGLKPDVGLSSIDVDNIGKTETKDYGEMMAAALNGDDGMPNPAVQAAPTVAAGPEANHIPEMDYSQPSGEPAEQPPMMQNGMLESVAPATEPVGVAHEGMMAATDVPASNEPGTVTASEGMNGDILPPPPAPPVDGGMMPPTIPESTSAEPTTSTIPTTTPEAVTPTAPASAELVNPVPATPEPAMPTSEAPATPVTPVVPESAPVSSTATPVTPVIPTMPTAPETAPGTTPETTPGTAPESPTQVGPTPTMDDPSAFRIPGM